MEIFKSIMGGIILVVVFVVWNLTIGQVNIISLFVPALILGFLGLFLFGITHGLANG